MTLLRLSSELHEQIAQYLDLESIQTLRLTCRELLSKTNGPRFRSFIANKCTDLSSQSLQNLAALSRHAYKDAVKKLNITVRCYDTSKVDYTLSVKKRRLQRQYEVNGATYTSSTVDCTEEDLAEARTDLQWLEEQARESAARDSDPVGGETVTSLTTLLANFTALKAVHVDAIVYQGQVETVVPAEIKDLICVWTRTAETYLIVMNAIVKSGVRLSSLKMFHDIGRCSIDAINLKPALSNTPDSWNEHCFTSLKHFAISISTRTNTDRQKLIMPRGNTRVFYLFNHLAPEVTAEENYIGLAYLLERMPNLESLDIHQTRTLGSEDWGYAALFDHVTSKQIHFPHLSSLSLRGVSITSAALITLLTSHAQTLKCIKLDHVFITDRAPWTPIFQILAQLPYLSRLHLQSLNTIHTAHPNPAVHLALQDEPLQAIIPDFDRAANGPGSARDVRFGWTMPCRDGTLVYRRDFNSRQEILENGLQFATGPREMPYGSYELSVFSEIRRAGFGI